MEEIFINCAKYSIKHKTLYKHLPNAYFHYRRMGHIIKECPLKASAKAAIEPGSSSPIKDVAGKSAEPKTYDTSILQPAPKKKSKENKKDKDFTSTPNKKSFKPKKIQGKMLKANFYSLLEKPDLLEEEEDRVKWFPATQLDGKHLEREVVAMDKTLDEIGSAFEVDDVPLNAVQEHLDEELLT